MSTTNIFRALRDLFPPELLQSGTVTATHANGTVTVQLPGGGTLRVRGTETVGTNVFVKDGKTEGAAPALAPITIDI